MNRLNIDLPLDKKMESFLAFMAKKRHTKSTDDLLTQILNEAMEAEEDFYFSQISDQREASGNQKINHDDFWQNALRD